jgi:hypothetical protein
MATSIRNKQQLQDWIMKKLGAPVLDVEEETSQIVDNIDDAVQLFSRHSGDVVYRSALVLTVTAGVDTYTLPDSIKSVLSFDATNGIGDGVNVLFSPLNQMYNMGFINFFSGTFGAGLASFEIGMQYLRNTEKMLTAPFEVRFNKYNHTVQLIPKPHQDMFGVLEAYTEYDPGTADSDLYNEYWIKWYSLALCKISLGRIWSKYLGMTIPGGATLNGAQLLQEGITEKMALEEMLVKTEGEPLGPMWG